MKTQTPFALAFFLTAIMTHAAPQPLLTVAVYDFKGDGEAASYGNNVTTLVTADLTTETNLVLVERAELAKALNEQAFGVSGMVSSDMAAKIGQITGAKVLVAGQVMKIGDNHLVIVASIIGTETGRLFADKVEGDEGKLIEMTSELSRKIAQTIGDQATNLIAAVQESDADRLEQVIKGINGTNRPSVSINIMHYGLHNWEEKTVENALGMILLKTGFKVVDGNSDRKPDVEITGDGHTMATSRRGELYCSSYYLNVKIQERATGNIIAIKHQDSNATETGHEAAMTAAQINATDGMAGQILPLLAK